MIKEFKTVNIVHVVYETNVSLLVDPEVRSTWSYGNQVNFQRSKGQELKIN